MNRRTFLQTAAASILALSGCAQDGFIRVDNLVIPEDLTLEQIIGANEILLNFPDRLPGAKLIDKYLTPNASKVMVHVLQYHLIEGLNQQQKEVIAEVQNNIYDILEAIIKRYRIQGIYHEGTLDNKGITDIGLYAWINFIKSNPYMYHPHSKYKLHTFQDVLKYFADKQKYDDYLWYQDFMPYDAVYRLASEGKVDILPAQELRTAYEFLEMYKKWKKNIIDRIIFNMFGLLTKKMDACEDAFLKITAKDPNQIIVVLYGYDHAWGGKTSFGRTYKDRDSIKDNIAAYNEENPTNQLSLIEIVPLGI